MATHVTVGERTLRKALLWVAENPKAWKRLQKKCRRAAKCGQVFSVRRFCEDLRWDFHCEGDEVAGYKLPNAITPVLARFVAHNHPKTAAFMKTMPSVCDVAVKEYLEKLGDARI